MAKMTWIKTVTALIAIAAAGAQASAQTEWRQEKITVEDSTFRVKWKQGEVRVFNKAAIWKQSPAMWASMIGAAEKVTGCQIQHPYWQENALIGGLRCP